MHRILRSLHTSGPKAASHFTRPIRDHKISSLVPLINVNTIDLAFEPSHLSAVHESLKAKGAVQLQLEFPDKDSHYLERLVLNLHKEHQHGLPLDHSSERGWFWDVRPNPENLQSHGHQARSETMDRFDWHTDCSYDKCPPQYFALHVLHPDRCGGGTLSLLNVDRLLTLLSPFGREWLSTHNYQINVPPEFLQKSGETSIRGNLLSLKNDGVRVGGRLRLREDIMIPLTTNAEKALDELKRVLFSEAAEAEILHLKAEMLPEGSIILIDNQRWLHSRNEVKDPNRHLRRIRWGATEFGTAN